MLEGATVALKHGLYRSKFRTCEIKYTNISRPCSFTQAYFQASSEEPDTSQQFKFGDIFSKGIAILDAYISSDPSNIRLPDDDGILAALEKLLLYLLDIEKDSKILKAASKNPKEWTWTLVLAQHIFSKLVVSPNYLFDISAAYDCSRGCPCEDHDFMFGKKGDTSFGWEEGWHGRTDILMGDVPVLKVDGEETTLHRAPSTSSLSSASALIAEPEALVGIEVKNKDFLTKSELCQVFAETISFSFLKNKENEGVTLIPAIAVYKKHVSIYMYDSELDVFLQGGGIQLFPENTLNAVAVVAVWMTLNYKLFCNGVKDGMNKSGLHTQIDIAKYKKEVKAPCRKTSAEDDWLMDDKWLAV